jgi:hypothetical protein
LLCNGSCILVAVSALQGTNNVVGSVLKISLEPRFPCFVCTAWWICWPQIVFLLCAAICIYLS